jgi:hypothetical protein
MVYSVLVGYFKREADGSIHHTRSLVSKARFVCSSYQEAVDISGLLDPRPNAILDVRMAIEVRIRGQWVTCEYAHDLEHMIEDIQRAIVEIKRPRLPKSPNKAV